MATTKNSTSLAAVILAAGKGKRLKSGTPKVLHPIAGKPALWHVLQLARAARPSKIVVVVGHGSEEVVSAVRSWGIEPAPVFVEQARQLGTGHAVQVAQAAVGRARDVLVIGGDFDPVRPQDVRRLVASHRRSGAVATIAATELDDPGGYGRVVRNGSRLVEVIEDVDASPATRSIREVSIVLMAFRRADLFRALPRLDRRNRQREYYLNRVLPMFLEEGGKVNVVGCDSGGAMGLNSRAGLAAVERVVRDRINAGHMARGVTLEDPDATYIDVDVTIGADTAIRPNTFLRGGTRIGRGCRIGPSVELTDTTVGSGSSISFSVVDDAKIGSGCDIGPFARIRGGAVIEDGAEIGNYVEVKASRVRAGAKAKHLTYLGDADVGRKANVGAGTVTANYDGFSKHKTVIGDGASIGSDTMLVAPVKVGKGAVTGAGSVITKDVPAGALAVERSEVRVVPGYRARKESQRKESQRKESQRKESQRKESQRKESQRKGKAKGA